PGPPGGQLEERRYCSLLIGGFTLFTRTMPSTVQARPTFGPLLHVPLAPIAGPPPVHCAHTWLGGVSVTEALRLTVIAMAPVCTFAVPRISASLKLLTMQTGTPPETS